MKFVSCKVTFLLNKVIRGSTIHDKGVVSIKMHAFFRYLTVYGQHYVHH